MKSRILSQQSILVTFKDDYEIDQFMQNFQGEVIPVENQPLRRKLSNTKDVKNFLQSYTINSVVADTVDEVASATTIESNTENGSTMGSPASEKTSSSQDTTTADDSTIAHHSGTPTDVSSGETTLSTHAVETHDSVIGPVSTEVPVDLTTTPSIVAPPIDQATVVSQAPREVFRPIAPSPTEEYELDAQLFYIRRSLAKIEKAQQDFIAFSRRNLSESQIRRMERIIKYTSKLRNGIQPDL